MISDFVTRLLQTTDPKEILVCLALDRAAPVAAAVFARLHYPQDPRSVFILSPMAVAPDRQGTGIGQGLIAFGLDVLRSKGEQRYPGRPDTFAADPGDGCTAAPSCHDPTGPPLHFRAYGRTLTQRRVDRADRPSEWES